MVNFCARPARRQLHCSGFPEITSISQLILCKREKRITLHMRFLHRRDQESARICATKVNASWRNGLNDVVAESGGIFFIALTESGNASPNFCHCLPGCSSQLPFRFTSGLKM